MTTTIWAHFDGKVIVPHGQVDLPVDEAMMIQIAPSPHVPPVSPPVSPSPWQGARTKEDWQAFFEEMEEDSVEIDHFIDHSRESCYDDTIDDPD